MGHVALNDYLSRIERLLADNRLAEAVAHCRHILAQYPRHTATYRLYARALFEQQDYAGAIDLFRRILSAEPADMIAHAGLANAYHEIGDLPRAIWHLERAQEQEPYNRAIRQELQRLYASADSEALAPVGLSGPALARIHFRSGRYGQAAEEAEAILGREPDRLDLQVLQAEALFQDGRPVEALRLSMEVVEALPYCVSANAILAAVWRINGQDSAAEKHLRRLWSCTLLDAEGRNPGTVVGQAFLGDGRFSLPDRLYIEELDYTPAAGLLDFAGADWVEELQASGFAAPAPIDDVAAADATGEAARPDDGDAWQPDDELLSWLEQLPGPSSEAAAELEDGLESGARAAMSPDDEGADFESRLFGSKDEDVASVEPGVPDDEVAAAADTAAAGEVPDSEFHGEFPRSGAIESMPAPIELEDGSSEEPAAGADLLVWLEDVLEQGMEPDRPAAAPTEADIFFEPEAPPAESGVELGTLLSAAASEQDQDDFLASLLHVDDVTAEGPESEDAAPSALPATEDEHPTALPEESEPQGQRFHEPEVYSTMVGVYEEPLVIEPEVTPDDLTQLLQELTPEEPEAGAPVEVATPEESAAELAIAGEAPLADEPEQSLAELLDELSQGGHDRDAADTPALKLDDEAVEADMSEWLSELLGAEDGPESQAQEATAERDHDAESTLGEAEQELTAEYWNELVEEAAGETEGDLSPDEGPAPAAPVGDFDWLSELAAQTGTTAASPSADPHDDETSAEDRPPDWFSSILEGEAAEAKETEGELKPTGAEDALADDIPDWLQELAEKSRRGDDVDD